MKSKKILNIKINNLTMSDALKYINKGFVVTPNVDHLVKLQYDKQLYKIYSLADYVLCDSKIIQLASKFLGEKLEEKISGSDFFPAFYKFHKENDSIKIFLLGASEGVAKKAAKEINKKIGRDIIIGAISPSFGFENNKEECQEIIHKINNLGATVLAIGVGSPKGEKWLFDNKEYLPNIEIFMSIGATIDFEAGNVKRAPEIISKIGLEWLFRLLSEPKRLWKRYLIDDIPFFWLILKQKFGFYKNPFKEI